MNTLVVWPSNAGLFFIKSSLMRPNHFHGALGDGTSHVVHFLNGQPGGGELESLLGDIEVGHRHYTPVHSSRANEFFLGHRPYLPAQSLDGFLVLGQGVIGPEVEPHPSSRVWLPGVNHEPFPTGPQRRSVAQQRYFAALLEPVAVFYKPQESNVRNAGLPSVLGK